MKPDTMSEHDFIEEAKVMQYVLYKFSWILTLTEVISIRILRMRVISAIMNFYWSHSIALQKLSKERSYKFSWILTLTEVISIRSLTMRIILLKEKSPMKNYSRRQTDYRQQTTTDKLAFQYSRLWVNNCFFHNNLYVNK